MVEFNASTHEYFVDGKKVISVTQLMRKHGLSPDYSGVSEQVLAAKAERGTLIHKEIEDYIKEGEYGFTDEFEDFLAASQTIKPIESEFIVNNDIVAGTCDLIYEENGETILADFKTTATLHKDAISWQLSIYKALYNLPIDKLKAFHFTPDGLKIVEIPEKPIEEIERLFECERNGEIYSQNLICAESQIQQLIDFETYIQQLDAQKKQIEAQAAEVRAAILEAMKKAGTISFESPGVKITYVAPYQRTSIDTAKLKKDLPEIYEEYQKQTTVKESLKITIKE